MSIKSRQQEILDILNERKFITVKELSQLTFTSQSSIRRDLTFMENNGLVKRSHGGVCLPNPLNGVASFYDRSHQSIKEKRIIASKASVFLKDGQNIFLDSSSTSSFLLPFIAKKKDIHLFTNNLSTAVKAIEFGINTHCLGGSAVNGSVALSGAETYRAISGICADIVFFSSQSLDSIGNITDSTEEENYVRQLMLRSSKTSVFVCDSTKFGTSSVYRLCSIDDIDNAVFDSDYSQLTAKCNII